MGKQRKLTWLFTDAHTAAGRTHKGEHLTVNAAAHMAPAAQATVNAAATMVAMECAHRAASTTVVATFK